MGHAPRWQLLFNQKNPERLSRLLHYHDSIIQTRQEELSHYQDSLDKLHTVEQKILAAVTRLQSKKNDLEREHDRLVKQRTERERVLARIKGLIKSKDQELDQQYRQKKELERVISAASRIAGGVGFGRDHSPFEKRKGKLLRPLSGEILNRYGGVRNGSLRWDGVLFKATTGTSVKAVHSGLILFADWLPGQGLLLIVDHGEGYMTLYAHNEVLLVEPGEWVEGGDTIARSGNSGGQPVAGLYFEIRHKGKPTNPTKWFKRG